MSNRTWRRYRNFVFSRNEIVNCIHCNCLLTFDTMTVDHLIPKKVDPTIRNTYTNFAPACSECNHSRGHQLEFKPISSRNIPNKDKNSQPLSDIRKMEIEVLHSIFALIKKAA